MELGRAIAGLELALGPVDVGGGQHRAQVLEPKAVLVQRAGIHLDPHRRQRAAAGDHLPHALDLGELLHEDAGGGVVHLAAREGVGGQREDQHRRVGRVHLAIGRVVRQRGRQVGAGGIDGGLHVAGGTVDVTVQVEL